MNDVALGIIAVVAGVLLCLLGQWALRVLLAVWGGFVGFAFGAGLASRIEDVEYLTTPLGWILGILIAILFAALAYLYYAVSIVIAMAAMGFVIGGTIATAFGATADWVIVLVGAAGGVVLAILAIAGNLPQILLIVVSSLAGAALIIGGIMLLVGTVDTLNLTTGEATAEQHPAWFIAFAIVAVIGIVVQFRGARSAPNSTMQDSWQGAK